MCSCLPVPFLLSLLVTFSLAHFYTLVICSVYAKTSAGGLSVRRAQFRVLVPAWYFRAFARRSLLLSFGVRSFCLVRVWKVSRASTSVHPRRWASCLAAPPPHSAHTHTTRVKESNKFEADSKQILRQILRQILSCAAITLRRPVHGLPTK